MDGADEGQGTCVDGGCGRCVAGVDRHAAAGAGMDAAQWAGMAVQADAGAAAVILALCGYQYGVLLVVYNGSGKPKFSAKRRACA